MNIFNISFETICAIVISIHILYRRAIIMILVIYLYVKDVCANIWLMFQTNYFYSPRHNNSGCVTFLIMAAAGPSHDNPSHYPLLCKECNFETLNVIRFIAHLKRCPEQTRRIHCPMCQKQYSKNNNRNTHIKSSFLASHPTINEDVQAEINCREDNDLPIIRSPSVSDNYSINHYEKRILKNKKRTAVIKQQCTDKVLGDQQFNIRLKTFERTNLLALFLSNAVSMTLFVTVITLIHLWCDILMDRVLEIVTRELESAGIDDDTAIAFITKLKRRLHVLRKPFHWLQSPFRVMKALQRADYYKAPVCHQFMTTRHSVSRIRHLLISLILHLFSRIRHLLISWILHLCSKTILYA